MTRSPAENQQTVEALVARATNLRLDGWERAQAVRDLAAQASRTQEWKQLAEDMGVYLDEAECEGWPTCSLTRRCDRCALLARLHDLAAGNEAK